MTTQSTPAQAPPPTGDRLTRRAAVGKLRYVAPAIVAIEVVHPQTALGRSGPLGKAKGK